MRPKLSSTVRSQTQTLIRSRLEAVPSLVRAKPQPAAAGNAGSQPPAPEKNRPQGAGTTTGAERLTFQTCIKTCLTEIAKFWRWLVIKRQVQVSSKRLRVVETASLGEKRFVAVLRVDGAQFLIGGGANSVSLLATLEGASEPNRFAQLLQQTAQDGSAAH